MAQITIQDSGFLKTDDSGTQLTGDDIANSGNAIVLKSAKMDYIGGASLDDSPYIGTYDNPDVNVVGYTATGFTINANLHKDNATELGYIGALLRLRKTVGYKMVFYDGASEELPSNQSIYQVSQEEGTVFSTAQDTLFSISNAGTYYVPCHVKSVAINDGAKKGVVTVKIVCIVTKKF